MDLITLIVGALAKVAAAAGKKKLVSLAVNDAYNGLKTLIVSKYESKPKIGASLQILENKPDSTEIQEVLEEALREAGADHDEEIRIKTDELRRKLEGENLLTKTVYQGKVQGCGALAQGKGAVAAGAGGIAVGGNVHGRTLFGNQLELPRNREITVTGHALDGTAVFQFKEAETYLLRFGVGPESVDNLATGDTAIKDVPKEGLRTHWVATSTEVEFVPALSSGKVYKIGNTWVAEFDLLIPESGSSKTEEVGILGSAAPGILLVTIYSVFADGRKEIYREVSVSLAVKPEVIADETCKAPKHTHLRTTNEWTTPSEHIQISIKNGVAEISTKQFHLIDHAFIEPFSASDNLISGAIQNVRDSLEKFREIHETYLNDLDPADISTRLATESWQTYYANTNGWQPLPDTSDGAHKMAFDQMQKSIQWRALASDGYALFSRCFPEGTKLRSLLKKLLPGSRIDFHWTEQSGPGWVSHVPWALMYMEPVDVTGQTLADPEKFLGLRFRIGTRSWRVKNGSVALGGLHKTSRMHLLYWGNKPGDDVAVEAKWQMGEFNKWKQSRLLPNSALPDLKKQVVLALDAPGPSPVSVLYFYCHCSVGDGAQPCLRFGNTSRPEDTVGRTELSQRSIPDGPIIFANACTTSQGDPHMTSELEQRFFKRGVRAFIGTETKVPIKLASKFAWLYFQFFYRCVNPSPMAAGEALTQARLFLWTQYKNVGGMFYNMANQYDLYLASDKEVVSLRR
ncbi:MAG: hypothetical protein R3B95_20455 [Nitrospirales bacterium]|nr:hypothetical protein [Nitrospirales bacterium]